MENYLKKLIEKGENQQLDFKYCVSDSRKIARSLVAFANTDGGKLLIGVRDNGSIAGIRSEEEFYMVETAVHLHCRPEIGFKVKQHTIGGKTILEVDVEKGEKRIFQARDENAKWVTYFRHNDQNLVANRIMKQVWRRESSKAGILVKFGKPENDLLEYFKKKGSVTFSQCRKITGIPARKAETLLINLILLKVVSMKPSEKGIIYELNNV